MSMYISGIASGIDTDAWIEAVMALERRPITQLQQRKNTLQQQKDAWRDINTRLNNLSSRLSDLQLSSTYLSRTATSSDTGVLTVSAGTAAAPGRYKIEVVQLAQAHRVASDQFDPEKALGLNGTIRINGQAITIAAGDTLTVIAQKINEAGAGVSATIIDGRLVITASEMNKAIQFVGGGGVLTGLGILSGSGQLKHELQAPQAAKIIVDGLEVTRASNTINDVLPGVTLTLQDTGETVVVVQHDVNRAVERIRAFVDQYNSVQSFISDKTGKGQILQGDVLLQRIQAQLRQDATAPVNGQGLPYNQLALIGISVDRHGTMTLDEAKLRAALNEDPDAVRRLFAATPEEDGFAGVAVRLRDRLEMWLQTSGGALVSRQQMFDARMQDIDRSIERLEERLALREQTLRRQFVALEEVMSAFQVQSTWLEGQLQQLSAFAAYQSRRR
ncbi:MAG TPA: flagellar filament capping protein FliD [Limnochordales bacterium]